MKNEFLSVIEKAAKRHAHSDWSPASAFEAGFSVGVSWLSALLGNCTTLEGMESTLAQIHQREIIKRDIEEDKNGRETFKKS
jgi:hypothetical protein